MPSKISKLFYFSLLLTITGLLLDSDPKEASTIMRFVEFFGMLAILFSLSFAVYFFTELTRKRLIKLLK